MGGLRRLRVRHVKLFDIRVSPGDVSPHDGQARNLLPRLPPAFHRPPLEERGWLGHHGDVAGRAGRGTPLTAAGTGTPADDAEGDDEEGVVCMVTPS